MFRRRRGVWRAAATGIQLVSESAVITSSSDGTATTLDVNKPNNTRAGDLVVVVAFFGRNLNAGASLDTTPNDGLLTYIDGVNQDTILIPADFSVHQFYRTAAASEPSTYTLDFSNASACTTVSIAFRQVVIPNKTYSEDGEDDYDNWVGHVDGGTVTTAKSLGVFSLGGMSQNGTTNAFSLSSSPTDFVEIANDRATQHASDAGKFRYVVGYRVFNSIAAAAAEQPFTFSAAVASGNVMGGQCSYWEAS